VSKFISIVKYAVAPLLLVPTIAVWEPWKKAFGEGYSPQERELSEMRMVFRVLLQTIILVTILASFSGKGYSTPRANARPNGEREKGPAMAITGRVVDYERQGLAGFKVEVIGQCEGTTDSIGNFTVEGARAPYDILLSGSPATIAVEYKGLTRTDPTLMFPIWRGGTDEYLESVKGKIIGGDFAPNQPANVVTKVRLLEAGGSTTEPDGSFGLRGFAWSGAIDTTATLFALQTENDLNPPQLPVAYIGYGLKTVAFSKGSSNVYVMDTLQALPTSQLRANISVPPGYALSRIALWLRISQFRELILNDFSKATSIVYNVPDIPGATIDLEANVKSETHPAVSNGASAGMQKVFVRPTASEVSVAVQAAPQLVLPPDGAAGVDTATVFSWTRYPDGIYVFTIGGTGTPGYTVVTSENNTTIPNLRNLGFHIQDSARYWWEVRAYAPLSSIDAAAGPYGYSGPIASLDTDASQACSERRFFTYATERNVDSTARVHGRDSLYGKWESTTTSNGGIGFVLDFSRSGQVTASPTVLVNGSYRVEGDLVTRSMDGSPNVDSLRFSVSGDTLEEWKAGEKDTLRMARVLPLGESRALSGRWTYKHHTGAIAFEDFTEDGMWRLRIPMASTTSAYVTTSDTLSAEGTDFHGAYIWKIDNDVLQLKEVGGKGSSTFYSRSH